LKKQPLYDIINSLRKTFFCYQLGDNMATSKAIKVTEHSDSQHGWLAVKRDKVHEIMGLENVTRYSYQKGNTVYLECDEDLTNFIKAVEDKGIELETKLGKHYDSSPIRHYDIFCITEADKALMTEIIMTDHTFSAFLENKGALNNFKEIPNRVKEVPNTTTVEWYNQKENVVAKAVYDNSLATRTIFTF